MVSEGFDDREFQAGFRRDFVPKLPRLSWEQPPPVADGLQMKVRRTKRDRDRRPRSSSPSRARNSVEVGGMHADCVAAARLTYSGQVCRVRRAPPPPPPVASEVSESSAPDAPVEPGGRRMTPLELEIKRSDRDSKKAEQFANMLRRRSRSERRVRVSVGGDVMKKVDEVKYLI